MKTQSIFKGYLDAYDLCEKLQAIVIFETSNLNLKLSNVMWYITKEISKNLQ